MPTRLCLLFLAVVSYPAPLLGATATGSLRIVVTGFQSAKGPVRLQLFDSETSYLQRQPLRSATLAIASGRCEWIVDELPPGDYAVIVHHDTNGNGRLDHSSMGPPVEPLAFSNGARGVLGSPSFSAVRFPVGDGENPLYIRLEAAPGSWSVGLGMITGTRPYRGIGGRFIAVPLIGYEGERLSWRGPSLSYRFADVDVTSAAGNASSLSFSALLETRFDGYDHDDTSRLDGMEDRDFSLDAGLGVAWKPARRWTLEAAFLRDILGKHKGQEFRGVVKRAFPRGRWTVTPSVGFNILSNRTADYYYGVRRAEARADRPAHNVGSAFNWEAGVGLNYRSSGHWMGVANVGVEILDPDINDSPIVARDTVFNAFVGILYVF